MRLRWKILLSLLGLVVVLAGTAYWLVGEIYLRVPEVEVGSAEIERLWESEALRSDLDSMLATMERVHPNLYAYTPDSVIRTRAREVREEIDAPMDRLAFYRIASRLNELFVDGHTHLRVPDPEWRAFVAQGGTVFPWPVRIVDGALTVGEPDAPTDVRILSIDGIPAGEIVDRLLSSRSGETRELKERFLEASFGRLFWAQYGSSERFVVETTAGDGSIGIRTLSGVPPTGRTTGRTPEADTARIRLAWLADGRVAHLDVNTFDVRLSALREHLTGIFEEIAQGDPHHLVIDVRGNGGGDSQAGEMLLSFVSATLPPQTQRVEIKASAEIKDYYRRLFPRGFRWISPSLLHPVFRGLYATPEGEIFRYDFGGPVAAPERTVRYGGPVTVLIDERSYSSATMFAAGFKALERGRIVGRETGEPMIFYGDNYVFHLPNTRLEASVSHRRFHLPGAVSEDRGVVPDVVVEEREDALAVALEAVAGGG